MAAVDAPYERLPMELRLWYCAQRKGIAHNSQWYHWIIFPMTGSLSMTLFRCYTNTNDIRYCPTQPWQPRTPLRSTFHGATALILHPHLVFIIYLHNTLLDFSDLDYFLDGRSLPLIVILMWKTNGYRCNNKPEWGVEGVICCGNRTPAYYLYNHHNQQLCQFFRLPMIFPQPKPTELGTENGGGV